MKEYTVDSNLMLVAMRAASKSLGPKGTSLIMSDVTLI